MQHHASLALILAGCSVLLGCPSDAVNDALDAIETASSGATESGTPGATETGNDAETDSGPVSASASATGNDADTATDSGTDTDSGTQGDSGEAGMFCVDECQEDADCAVAGMASGLTCQSNRCLSDPADACADDDECVALFSGWASGTVCAAQADCDAAMQVCLEVDGTGRCATAPSEFIDCAAFGFEELDVTNIDGDAAIVCANAGATCAEEGFCVDPCDTDTDCPGGPASVCDAQTGFCGCGSDADCEGLGSAGQSVCLDSGVCGCGADQDCVDSGLGDVCSDGACGCSSDAACSRDPVFDSTTVVCG